MFETFEHTTDLGLRVRAAELNDVFAEAGRGLFSIIVENPDAIRPQLTLTIELKAKNQEKLFFDWLSELLFRFDNQQWVFCRFDVKITGASLKAKIAGEHVDHSRHWFMREVKSITHYGLMVKKLGEHWEAEAIVDI